MTRYTLSKFPVCCTRKGGKSQAPICSPPMPVPRRGDAHQRNHKGGSKGRDRKEIAKESVSVPSSSSAMKESVGRNSGN